MNRWLLHRYTATEIWLRAQTDRLTDRLTTSTRGDRGQTSFEYLGIAVVIAVIIGVLATTSIGDAVQRAILRAINRIAGN
jgi:hypothetical protein